MTVRWHGEYTTFTDLYENKTDAAIEARMPNFENHFTGMDDDPLAPPPEDNGFVPPPIDSYDAPEGRGAKKKQEKPQEAPPESADGFSFGDDPFSLPVKPRNDDDII